MNPISLSVVFSGLFSIQQSLAASPPLIVVGNHGGVSALPYYVALGLQPSPGLGPIQPSLVPTTPFSEVSMLPVHSSLLTPGQVSYQKTKLPGMMPFFILGDDAYSNAWLQQHAGALRKLNAVGLVVNVESLERLQVLRNHSPGLFLIAESGDELAQRFGLTHYPALITSMAIEQ